MKKVMLSLALLPALALSAAAQDFPWNDFAVGDRIEITFRSGGTIGGTLVSANPRVKTVDYAKEASLTLDITMEYPGVNGTMTVQKKEIMAIRKIRDLDEKTRQSISDIKQKIAAENAKAAEKKAAEKKVETPEPAVQPPKGTDEDARKAAEEEAKRKAEELKKKAIEFYAKFPSPYWGPERHTMNEQKKLRGQAWSQAESDFEKGYQELWQLGKDSAPKPAEK